jgi:phage terminase large subunit-like protein
MIERIRRDKVPYDYWIEQGWIKTTAGSVVDFDYIEQEIRADADRFQIQEIGYDPWKAREIVTHFTNDGITMVPIRQGYSGMAAPTDEAEKKILARELAHGGNPVMAWMISCAEPKSDRQGNVMLMKPKRQAYGKRIDGVVAMIMALDRAVRHQDNRSVYEERGAIII